MSKRAVIYARVSTDDQRSNFSIPTQLAECMKHVQAKGYGLVGDRYVCPETGKDTTAGDGAIPAFVDDYTSRELSRPGLDAAFMFLETLGFDVVVVHSLDRLARDPYIRQTLEIEFSRHDAKVEYVLGNYEDTPEGEVRKDLESTFAKWENAKRVERCNRGKRGKARSGLFVHGRPPFGYTIDQSALGGLAVDEKQATMVRHIFDLYVNHGLSIRAIARTMTDEGVAPALGGPKWGRSSVGKVLRNPVYVGHFFYNKTKQSGTHATRRERQEWIEIESTPIVEQELFEEAQRKLAESHKLRRRVRKRFYMLSGMVVCAECGRAYGAQTAKAGKNRRINEAQSYRHRVNEGHCMNRMISARRLEPAVWDAIAQALLHPENLRQGYEQALLQHEAASARYKAELKVLHHAATKLEQQGQNLTTAYLDPEIGLTKSEYVAHRMRIEDELKEVGARIEQLETTLAAVPVMAELETFEQFTAEIRDRLESGTKLTRQDKRRILQLLHVKVLIHADGRVRLEGWFMPDSDWKLPTVSKRSDRQPPQPPARA